MMLGRGPISRWAGLIFSTISYGLLVREASHRDSGALRCNGLRREYTIPGATARKLPLPIHAEFGLKTAQLGEKKFEALKRLVAFQLHSVGSYDLFT